ncbi:type IV secretion system protein [Sphingomonas sp.]|uniref:type IV secretion system protein n=1 Tax=Sphingomonas sp. TaxID=28214 RepID=UPI003B3BDE90
MTSACVTPPESTGYIGSVSRFVDCRLEIFDTSAFSALTAPGSTLSILLTGLLTIFVALIGYNLLIGRGLGLRGSTLAIVKVGVVLTLAMNWAAYRTLIYDVVIEAPGQVFSEIGRPSGLQGSDGTLLQRLDFADQGLQQLAIIGAGQPNFAQAQNLPPPPIVGFNALALGGSRILFLITALIGIIGVRVVAGLMLAIGPFLITSLLFENTRSLFEGWIRILAGALLAAIGVSVTLGLELTMLEPWLSDVLARRAIGESLPSAPTELFVTAIFFSLIVMGSAHASMKLAAAFRLARFRPIREQRRLETPRAEASLAASQGLRDQPQIANLSRAVLTANVIASMQQRETAGSHSIADSRMPSRSYSRPDTEAASKPHGAASTGRAFPRRAKMHPTASSGRRDRIA